MSVINLLDTTTQKGFLGCFWELVVLETRESIRTITRLELYEALKNKKRKLSGGAHL